MQKSDTNALCIFGQFSFTAIIHGGGGGIDSSLVIKSPQFQTTAFIFYCIKYHQNLVHVRYIVVSDYLRVGGFLHQ